MTADAQIKEVKSQKSKVKKFTSYAQIGSPRLALLALCDTI